MMALVSIRGDTPTGWITGSDTHDLRRQVGNVGDDALASELARLLYATEFPRSGRHLLVNHPDGRSFWLLVT